jgi:hypothetical protein
MITPEKLQTPEKPLDSGEASIYVLVWRCLLFSELTTNPLSSRLS